MDRIRFAGLDLSVGEFFLVAQVYISRRNLGASLSFLF